MKLFLGVDGGQTTTKVVLGDEQGKLLACAIGGASNHTEEPGGPERLEKVVRSAVQQVLQTIHVRSLEGTEFAAACFGMTGETEIKHEIIRRTIRTRHLSVVHDSVNALAGATAGEPGLIVLAGTGSVARGRNAEGRELRVGGWGHLFGDEGSAYWISREAIRAILAEFDLLGEKTRLSQIFLARLGVASGYELMANYYSGFRSREHMAGLAIWVNEAAEAGDIVAEEILRRAGVELARFALGILSLLFVVAASQADLGDNSRRPLVCYAGEVFRSDFVLSSFGETILKGYPQAQIRAALLPPVLGSLLLAYRAGGIEISKEVSRGWPERVNELQSRGCASPKSDRSDNS